MASEPPATAGGDDGRRKPPRSLLPVVVAMTSIGVLTFSLINPALPDLADELEVSRGAIGVVQGAVALPGVFLAVLIGWFADRFGRRQAVQFSLLLFGVAGMGAFFARDFWLLVGLRTVQGIGTSGLMALGVVVIGDVYTGATRRWALGVNAVGITVTGMVAPIIGGVLAQGGAFRPFLLFGLALPLMIPAARFPGRPDESPAPPLQHLRGMFSALRASGRLADYLGLLPFSMLALLIFAGFGFTTTPLYLESEFGLDALRRGLVQATLSLGAMTTSFAAGRLARRMRGSLLVNLSLLSVIIGFAVLAAAPGLVVVMIGLYAFGLGVGALFPVFQDMASSAAPGAYRGAAVGTWASSIRFGQAAGPVIASTLAVSIGGRGSYALAAGLVVVMAIVWRPLRTLANARIRRAEPDYRPLG